MGLGTSLVLISNGWIPNMDADVQVCRSQVTIKLQTDSSDGFYYTQTLGIEIESLSWSDSNGIIAVRSGIAGARDEALAIQTDTHAGGLHGGAEMFKRKRTEGSHMTLQAVL